MEKILWISLAVLIFVFSSAAQEKEILVGAGDFYLEQVTVKRTTALCADVFKPMAIPALMMLKFI